MLARGFLKVKGDARLNLTNTAASVHPIPVPVCKTDTASSDCLNYNSLSIHDRSLLCGLTNIQNMNSSGKLQ